MGKVDTDSNGLARFLFKLQVPPGISHEAEPELSLVYSQGGQSGYLGSGWALGGLSAVREAPSNLAFDGNNPVPTDYDPTQPKLSLDGAELLNIAGRYGDQSAQYSTETEGVRRIVRSVQGGFTALDSTGRQSLYGTTEDSRVLSYDKKTVREWKLSQTSDYHGNAVDYTYTANPLGARSSVDLNACYISSIRYSSNTKTGYKGDRIIKFVYDARPDVLVQTLQGCKCVWGSLMTSIQFGVLEGETVVVHRTYDLSYRQSQETGDSLLTSIVETGLSGDKMIKLTPSIFDYSTTGIANAESLFRTAPSKIVTLAETSKNVTLIPMNISGRGLNDIACFRYDRTTSQMSVKAFLTDVKPSGDLTWLPSDEATLPVLNTAGEFPNILTPDLNGDGRADLVIPFANINKQIVFATLQSTGRGFKPYKLKQTTLGWVNGAKFLAMDLTGRGTADVVQIYKGDGQKIAFRRFPALARDGNIELMDAISTTTMYADLGTIDWVQINHSSTGVKSLVRVWAEDIGYGNSRIKTTTFTLGDPRDPNAKIAETTTSVLLEKVSSNDLDYSVLACDINADGTQDIVIANAKYVTGSMTMSYTTFLGDGNGSFSKHGETLTRGVSAPPPSKSSKYGQFHITNLNCSDYPSLSYVYPRSDQPGYFCISVEGQSNGLCSAASKHDISGFLPNNKMNVVPVDMNGDGLGDWLFHSIENDIPRIIVTRNLASVPNFLSSVRDSLGLRTTLKYSTLTDTNIYDPGVDWRAFTNDSLDSYPVLGAPNYVVTQLVHSNDPDINAYDYKVVINKKYKAARINVKGRGWQGFRSIETHNVVDDVLTTETYHQAWPLTGSKLQIDTRSSQGPILRSIKSAYQIAVTRLGPWSIHRVDRTRDQTDMLVADSVVRSNGAEQTFDTFGNVTSLRNYETQYGSVVHEVYTHCSYTTIDGVSNVMTGKKVTTNAINKDMTFRPGDVSLIVYVNDEKRAVLRASLEWSTDANDFARKEIEFNAFGKETRTISAAGLEVVTTYDEKFKTYPVKVVQSGPGISITELTAFHAYSGIEVAHKGSNGLLTCYSVDPFGRVLESRASSPLSTSGTKPGVDFLQGTPFIGDAALVSAISSISLVPQRSIDFSCSKTSEGLAFLGVRVTTFAGPNAEDQHQVTECVDCTRQPRQRYTQNGLNGEKTWISWEYNSRGQCIFESLPSVQPENYGFGSTLISKVGRSSSFDVLGREIMRRRPAHGKQAHHIMASIKHTDGGAWIEERTFASEDDSRALAVTKRRFIQTDSEPLVIESIDENGLRTTLAYDAVNRLCQCSSPSGEVETRKYNSRGDLTELNNIYQNPSQTLGSAALRFTYDLAGRMTSRTNASGETTTYTRDSKGRPLTIAGKDNRVVKYTYGPEHPDSISSIAIHPRGLQEPAELCFKFSYDYRGRLSCRQLALMESGSHATTMEYDWQDRLKRKVFPNGNELTHKYRGTEMIQSQLSNPNLPGWTVDIATNTFDAFGRPRNTKVGGAGFARSFQYGTTSDAQGFPTESFLVGDQDKLVHERYTYNDLDQISEKIDETTASNTVYKYAGRRLASSQRGTEAPSIYSYDTAGNLQFKAGISIKYDQGHAIGESVDKKVFDISYDRSGRCVRRITEDSSLTFDYDSLGHIRSIEDESRSKSITFIVDSEGSVVLRKHSDGSSDLFVDHDYSIHVSADGTRTAKQRMHSHGREHEAVLVTVVSKIDVTGVSHPADIPSTYVHFSDTKGSITHTFSAQTSSLRNTHRYDDFGAMPAEKSEESSKDHLSTFEGNFYDDMTGLLDFGARWYDPLVGRFTVPDDILEVEFMLKCDGLNRYAFENNDPINHVDPTGHWSLSAIFGVVFGVLLVAASIAATVLTAGAASPLAVMLSSALIGGLASGGIAGITYSINHKDEKDAGKFWYAIPEHNSNALLIKYPGEASLPR